MRIYEGLAAPVATEQSFEDMQMHMQLSPHDISLLIATIYSNMSDIKDCLKGQRKKKKHNNLSI